MHHRRSRPGSAEYPVRQRSKGPFTSQIHSSFRCLCELHESSRRSLCSMLRGGTVKHLWVLRQLAFTATGSDVGSSKKQNSRLNLPAMVLAMPAGRPVQALLCTSAQPLAGLHSSKPEWAVQCRTCSEQRGPPALMQFTENRRLRKSEPLSRLTHHTPRCRSPS